MNEPPIGCNAAFVTTHWSLVLAALEQGSSQAEGALAKLCATYWYPIYTYVRRRGYTAHDAEDLTQEFFARIIGKDYLAELQREGGRFRSFLLSTLKHFLAKEWNRARAQKRGGANQILSWDELEAEQRYALEPADSATPEDSFERRWAISVLDTVLSRLRDEYTAAGKAALFAQLQPLIGGSRGADVVPDAAGTCELSDGAQRVALHRLRRRFGQMLRQEISHTVATQAEIDGEIRHLIAAACGAPP